LVLVIVAYFWRKDEPEHFIQRRLVAGLIEKSFSRFAKFLQAANVFSVKAQDSETSPSL
jgi:hypothetical protein